MVRTLLLAGTLCGLASESPAWPLLTMRQMSTSCFVPGDMKEMIAINARHPGSCDEYWLAEGYPFNPTDAIRRATALGEYARPLAEAGIVPGFQQGVTLGHDFSRVPDGGIVFSDAAYQVDVDGKKTAFLCPTSPEVLAHEERFAETYVRLGRLESFWLDDDLRTGFCKNRAVSCWCSRCLKLLNAKAGTNYTREEFVKRLDSSAANDPIRAVWGAFKAESLAGFAAAARRGAKRANPNVRLGYQAISSATIACGTDFRPILEALSDGFRDTVGIRPGHGFYCDSDSAHEFPRKILDVAREAERCRAYPGWHGSVVYEQENYPHFAMQKSAEAIVKEGAVALAAGCDALSQYWYSSSHPEPFEHYEDVARLTAAWRPYLKRLADMAPRTHLGGVARRIDPDLMTSRANTLSAQLADAMPRRDESDVRLALMGVPVTVAESGATGFYDPAAVPARHYTTAQRAALLDALDALPGGPVCVRVDKVHPLLVYPRVDSRGRTVAVTFLNVSVGLATGVRVRLRRPLGSTLSWARPCMDDAALAAERGVGDELRFVLPDLPAWAVATVFCESEISGRSDVAGNGPASEGPRADLRVLPGGALRLLDAEVTFRPGMYTEDWRFRESSAPVAGYAPAADGSWVFEIGKGTGLTGSGSFFKCPDGRVRASWAIEPKADVKSNGLVVMTALDGTVWRGGRIEADGRRIELPVESSSSRIFDGVVTNLTFSDARAERCFTLEFDKPQSLLLQDDRAVVRSCPTLTLRLFLSYGHCSSGKRYKLDAWFSGKSVHEFEEVRPVTIAEGKEWMPIVCDPDVIDGSALDFSGVMPGRHRPAGRFGRVVAVGEDFQFEGLSGVSQRFVGANVCGPSVALDEDVSKKLAKRFSAVGYNSVRIHNHDWVFCRGEADGTALDEDAMRKFDSLFAAFKDEGHYMTIDLFVNRKVPWRSCGIDRDGILSMGDFKLWVQFHEGVFSNFLAHADAFLSRVNVKTGIRYADDPALAFVSLVNEGNLGNDGREGLKKCPPAASAYAEYVMSHGGSDDDELLVKFLSEREAAFARRVRRHLREDLKCRVLLTNMNAWFYAPEIDQVRKTEFDYADQHCYVAHPTFLGKSWSLPAAGDMSNPLEREAFCLASRRLSGLPFVCSEWNYCVPLPARAQAGLVMGTLAASGRWNALWRYAWSDNPQPVLAPRSTPVQFFMIGADPLALATERATVCLFLRHDADALGAALERARRERRIVVNARGTSGGWCASGDLDAGFLKARLSSPAAVWVSALDGGDLAKASRLVVFHLTEVLNSGMKFSDGRLTMMSEGGHLPLVVRKGEARISLSLEGAGWRLYALATNGRRKKELALCDSHGRKAFVARTDCDASDGTLAYELVREGRFAVAGGDGVR